MLGVWPGLVGQGASLGVVKKGLPEEVTAGQSPTHTAAPAVGSCIVESTSGTCWWVGHAWQAA